MAPTPEQNGNEQGKLKGVRAMLENGDGIMTTYIDAVEDFRKSATAFMQHVDLLAQARDAYQQALTASAELRTVLDAGDESLRTLMTQLEQALNLHMATKPVLDRKKPEPIKVDTIKTNGESTAGVRAFP
jgi:ABC-type transporter Mla subunit MlaD